MSALRLTYLLCLSALATLLVLSCDAQQQNAPAVDLKGKYQRN